LKYFCQPALNMRKIIALALLVLLSCDEDERIDLKDSSYITFGHFYGFCLGEQCIEIFKLTDNGLYEDVLDRYPGSDSPYRGNFKPMDAYKFELVKQLRNELPSALLDIEERRIGQPDAGDWGGYYLEIVHRGKIRFWLMDKNELYLPENLKPFALKLGAYIEKISD